MVEALSRYQLSCLSLPGTALQLFQSTAPPFLRSGGSLQNQGTTNAGLPAAALLQAATSSVPYVVFTSNIASFPTSNARLSLPAIHANTDRRAHMIEGAAQTQGCEYFSAVPLLVTLAASLVNLYAAEDPPQGSGCSNQPGAPQRINQGKNTDPLDLSPHPSRHAIGSDLPELLNLFSACVNIL